MVRSPFDGVLEVAVAILRKNLAGNQTDTRNACLSISTGEADDSDAVIIDSRDGSGYMGSMVVRCDVSAVGDEIITVGGIGVPNQVFMIELHATVHDRDPDGRTAGRIVSPDGNDLHIGTNQPGSTGSFIPVLPLRAEFRIIERIAHFLGLDDRLIGNDSFHMAEDIRSLVFPDRGAVMDPIPAVESHFPGARLEFAGIREDPFHTGHTDFTQGIIERGGGPGCRHSLFDPRDGLFIQQDVRRSGDIDAFGFLFLRGHPCCNFGFHFLLTAGQEEKRQGTSEGKQSFLHGSRVGFLSENRPLPSMIRVVTI